MYKTFIIKEVTKEIWGAYPTLSKNTTGKPTVDFLCPLGVGDSWPKINLTINQ